LRQAYLLTTVLALALLPSNVVAGALPLLREDWDASAVEAGWVFAAYQVGYVVSVLVVLPLTDRLRVGRSSGLALGWPRSRSSCSRSWRRKCEARRRCGSWRPWG